MLKAHQACIDLGKDVLRIQGREVKFLSEHELPDKARDMHAASQSAAEHLPPAGPSTSTPSGSAPRASFPGSGNTLASASQSQPSTTPASSSTPTPRAERSGAGQSQWSEDHIQTLMNFGVSREVAIETLNAANGNIEVAASLLF